MNALTLVLDDVNDPSLGVGSMASIGALVGHLLSGQTVRNSGGLVSHAFWWWPDALPWLRLPGLSHVVVGCSEKLEVIEFDLWFR